MTVERILADELRPGDAIVFLGKPYPVDAISSCLGGDRVFGVARSGAYWAMALVSGERLDVVRGGVEHEIAA